MKTITDHELSEIANDWAKEIPYENIGIRTAFAAGYRLAEKQVNEANSKNGKLPIPRVRFQLPSNQQIVELAILFNDGNMDKEILTKMVSLADFIIDRLYENGDVSKPSSKEGN